MSAATLAADVDASTCEVEVENTGASFRMPRSECILDAALAQGIALPHQCRGASCGECKARVLEGRVDHGWSLGFAITDAEKDEGYCLACQAKPLTPRLRIRTVRDPAGAAAVRQITAKVVANTPLTPRVSRLVLAPTPGESLPHEAGDYAELVLPGIQPNRMYSFAAAPQPRGLLEFFIARHPHGLASGYVRDRLRLGDHVELRGPFGTCRMPPGAGPVIGLAGGTGLAPVLAIVEHSLRGGSPEPHTLVLSVRDDDEVFALDRLHALSLAYPNFSYHLLVTDAPSRFCPARMLLPQWLRERHASLAGSRAVIGGSPGFVQACTEACLALGMQQQGIATDSFTPLAASGPATTTGDNP
jgi:CDP-4-dehydro-6-deoxyglucose reductase